MLPLSPRPRHPMEHRGEVSSARFPNVALAQDGFTSNGTRCGAQTTLRMVRAGQRPRPRCLPFSHTLHHGVLAPWDLQLHGDTDGVGENGTSRYRRDREVCRYPGQTVVTNAKPLMRLKTFLLARSNLTIS